MGVARMFVQSSHANRAPGWSSSMATAGGGETLSPAKCNQVKQEQIWKDYVHREAEGVKKWETTWSFLCQHYIKLTNDIETIREVGHPKSAGSTKDSSTLKLPAIEDTAATAAKVSGVPFVPMKTSEEIGWRSGRNLETYGRWSRPKISIHRQLNWPIYACD